MSSTASAIIQQLSEADVEMLRALLHVFGNAFDEVETYSSAQPEAEYLQRLLGKDHFIALVALISQFDIPA